MSTAPPDQAARDRITSDLDTNLFVEAGAGAGKTSSLVGRIVALVESGVAIDAIAAITFTEKAAAELRHRVRLRLTEAVESARMPGEITARYVSALDRLDHAPIGTLHAFARRLLNEFPIAAGLPPGFTVLDELESDLAFEERWNDLLDRLLDDPEPDGGPVEGGSIFVQMCAFGDFGIDKGLRRAAIDFHDNWDLVGERVDRDSPAPWWPSVDVVVAAATDACTADVPDNDKQAEHLDAIRDAVDDLSAHGSLLGRLQALETLAGICSKAARGGNKTNWKRFSSEDALIALRDRQTRACELATEQLRQAAEYRKALVGAVLGRWVLESAQARAHDGQLEFHDLLVLARRLLSTDASARRSLHGRYQRILLDEFQDTDPIQLGIAVLLAADPDDPELRPLPGRLFIVGDPKQSIYRFRRADIAQYLRAADQLGATTERLTANFRSSAAVIDWVNGVFGRVIQFVDDTQPAYHELSVCRPGSVDHGSVRVLGTDIHDDLDAKGSADELRRREASDVAAAVASALADEWPVGDRDGDGQPVLRPCRPGDIAILLPARTSLPALEAALRELDLPYRAENSSVVYVTTEIRHLMLALRAADDTSDELALVAALRTPLYGCSDVDLWRWKQAGGRWSVWAHRPDGITADHPVAQAIDHLRTIADRRARVTPADLVAALVDERRVLDVALDDDDARDVWRRVRYVIEQARAWSDAGGHGLRRYLAWVQLQATEARAADTILPEHDHDAVRLMTVHAAKGLEFPITIVSGLTTRPRGSSGYSVVWPTTGWGLRQAHDDVFDEFLPIDEQMSDAERRRLLYVACTRAVDHLVVSAHRLVRGVSSPSKMTSAELLVDAGGCEVAPAVPFEAADAAYHHPVADAIDLEWPDAEAWRQERGRAYALADRVDSVSATTMASRSSSPSDDGATIDAGLDKEPVDLDLPPWQRGRYGTAVGRAVHAVLQFADLRTGHDIAAHAAAQCAAEGILGMDDLVASLARSAIAAPIVQQALDGRHHRELFVATAFGDRVLEGYIDLFVETPDGGVIVDYKTDQWPDDTEREQRIGRYRRQLAAYGVVLEQILDRPVAGAMLVRCRPDGDAEEIVIPRWDEALDEARALAAAPTSAGAPAAAVGDAAVQP